MLQRKAVSTLRGRKLDRLPSDD